MYFLFAWDCPCRQTSTNVTWKRTFLHRQIMNLYYGCCSSGNLQHIRRICDIFCQTVCWCIAPSYKIFNTVITDAVYENQHPTCNIHRWVGKPHDHHAYSDTSSFFRHVRVPPQNISWSTCGIPSVQHRHDQSTRPVSRNIITRHLVSTSRRSCCLSNVKNTKILHMTLLNNNIKVKIQAPQHS